jgi:malonate-semialdehyde dehydrogenase (acetylating)/methylmalonate-semialdehyde dehydrogenase
MNGSTSSAPGPTEVVTTDTTTTPTPSPGPTTVDAVATVTVTVCDNYINGEYIPSSTNEYLDVLNPANSKTIGKVTISNTNDVNHAVQIAKNAFHDESSGCGWSKKYTIKQRAACMMKLHSLIEKNSLILAKLIVLENGKNITEALADVAKGNETIEWACSLPSLACGNNLKVSSQVSCEDRRDPLGVVVSIVPVRFTSLRYRII